MHFKEPIKWQKGKNDTDNGNNSIDKRRWKGKF